MSDVVWQAIIAAVVTIILALIQWATNVKLNKLADVTGATHTLVNSNMGVQLRLVDNLSAWKAKMEPTPENIQAAEYAAKMLSEHEQRQATVDAQAQTQVPPPGN